MRLKCGEKVGRPHEMDELLELIWTLREQGRGLREELILEEFSADNGALWIETLVKEEMLKREGDAFCLTPSGEREAEQIIRRHRLTERLFSDVFKTREEVWEREACELEHQTVLTDEAVEAVCAFLGHPPTCPHGRPIPRGACCSPFQKEMKPFVIPLSESNVAEDYRIVFITPNSHRRLDRLAVLGIIPGSVMRIHQKRPSYVIRIGETDVALDSEVAQDIYVKKTS